MSVQGKGDWIDKIIAFLRSISPYSRVRWSAILLIVSCVAWLVSSLTLFAKEPQGILGLSWMAFIFTLINIILTADVRDKEEGFE